MSDRIARPEKTAKADKGPGTRENILTAALDEFARLGMAGARVDRIARAAGVNKAMIYYYFSSKEALYQSVIKEHLTAILGTIRQTITESERLEEILSAFAEVYHQAFSSQPLLRTILLRELADARSDVVPRIAQTIIASGLPEQMVKSYKAGIERGEYRPVDIRQTFVSFVLMNVGYFVLAPLIDQVWAVEDHREFANERKKAVIDLFMNGVKKR
ncbi:MAG: TetR/AcrR family transcriptional regulator [bacterium]